MYDYGKIKGGMVLMKDLINTFLGKNSDYSNDIKNFIEYLGNEGHASFYNEFTIRGMTTNVIIDSLKSYIRIGQIQKKVWQRSIQVR